MLLLHLAAAKMVSYEKQRCKTFYTSNRREEDKLSSEKAVDAVNMAKEVRKLLSISVANLVRFIHLSTDPIIILVIRIKMTLCHRLPKEFEYC